jgi:hypothetical protein
MKKVLLFLFAGLLAATVSCSQSKDITLSLTNPQNTAVEFDGYFQVNNGIQEAMTGTTPWEHTVIMEKGDELDGQVYKSDSTNFTDTLHFRILVDGEEQSNLTADIILPTEVGGVQFHLALQ